VSSCFSSSFELIVHNLPSRPSSSSPPSARQWFVSRERFVASRFVVRECHAVQRRVRRFARSNRSELELLKLSGLQRKNAKNAQARRGPISRGHLPFLCAHLASVVRTKELFATEAR
jgi:hypothetical protein